MKPKLTPYIGDEQFQQYLARFNKPIMPVYQIRTYLLGFIIAVELVSFDWILEEILLIGTDSEVNFKSEKEFQEFVSHILGLWNSISEKIEGGKAPKLSPLPSNLDDPAMLSMGVEIRMNELDYLLGAMDEGETNMEDCPDLRARRVLAWIEVNADFFENYLTEIQKRKPTKNRLFEVKVILEEFDRQWPDKFKVLENGIRKVRLARLKETSAQVHEKVGRNDLCPCGSGKKYKNCCGVMH